MKELDKNMEAGIRAICDDLNIKTYIEDFLTEINCLCKFSSKGVQKFGDDDYVLVIDDPMVSAGTYAAKANIRYCIIDIGEVRGVSVRPPKGARPGRIKIYITDLIEATASGVEPTLYAVTYVLSDLLEGLEYPKKSQHFKMSRARYDMLLSKNADAFLFDDVMEMAIVPAVEEFCDKHDIEADSSTDLYYDIEDAITTNCTIIGNDFDYDEDAVLSSIEIK